MATKNKPVGRHGTDAETGRAKYASKTKCPLSKEEFMGAAKQLTVTIDDGNGNTAKIYLNPQEFKTGSFGYYGNEKVDIKIGDTALKFQAGLNLTAVGSKPSAAAEDNGQAE